MRPRPATWTALVVSIVPDASPHSAAKCALRNRIPEGTHISRALRTIHDPIRGCNPGILINELQSASTAEAGGSSPAFMQDRLRRPHRPSFLNAPKRIFENPLADSPSRVGGYRQSAAVTSRLNATHACTVSTLREYRSDRNGKPHYSCAKTVEDETCLWKGKEKAE